MSKYPIPFGRHLLLERINVGGMAEVFRAKSFGVEGFERIVAVKRILPTLADDEEFITMFIDEARIAAHLTHQNIVQIFELNRAEKTFFISMEYVAGHDLRLILDHQKKQRRPMEVPKAAFIVSRVAEALEYAHRKRDPAGRDLKIIHRDVTPQNVIVSFEGEVKLCDFGIAKAATRVSRTQVGVLKGKFAYMSPEQVRGQPTDRRSDIFALGVIFYEMLTGERLFLGESDYATLDSVRQAVIPPPSKYNPNLSPGLEAVLLKMLARDPKDRYQWAAEVHEDLLDHLIHDGKRPYHGRHLRAWMQETYARDVEVENAKLEEFVRLRMPADLEASEDEPGPRPSEAVAELAEKSVAADPADLPRHDEEFQDATDAIPAVSAKAKSPAPKGVLSSPVASLYGAAVLANPSEEGSPGGLVMPSGPYEEARAPRRPSHPTTRLDTEEGPVEEPSADAERTQYDMVLQPGVVSSGEGAYDPEVNDTVIGGDELEGEISAAQAELIAQLDRAGALDTGDTVDASEESFADGRVPEIGELSDGQTLQGDEDEPMNEDTPLGIAPTFVREGSGPGFGAEATAEGRGRGDLEPDPELERPVVTAPAGPTRAKPSAVRSPRADGSGWGGPGAARATPSRAAPAWGRPASTLPPNLGTPYVPPHFESTPEEVAPAAVESPPLAAPRPPRSPRLVMALAGGVALLTTLLLGLVLLALGPNEASLEITTSPITQVEVKLDGKLVASRTPALVPALALGEHRVELSAPGFRGHVQTIQIVDAKPHTMVVPLEIAGPPPQEPRPPAGPEETELPPGEPMEDGPAPSPPAPSPESPPAKAEVRSPVAAKPSPAPPTKAAAPKAEAPLQAKAPRPEPKARAKPQGSLLVSTTPQGVEVIIDGKKTGLKTPIRQPYALAAGKHQITFVLSDGASYNFEVVVNEGEVTKLIKPLR